MRANPPILPNAHDAIEISRAVRSPEVRTWYRACTRETKNMPQLCHSSAVISLADCDGWATSVCIVGTASPFTSHTCVMCWVCARRYVSTVSSFCFTCPPACRCALCAALSGIFAPLHFALCACTLDGSQSHRLSPSELDLHADSCSPSSAQISRQYPAPIPHPGPSSQNRVAKMPSWSLDSW